MSLNVKKSMIFTSDDQVAGSDVPVLLEAAGDFINIVRHGEHHKYLGCMLSGDLRCRGRNMLHHRLRCAWGKFSCFRHALVDKHIDVRLRLRLFDAVVTPCALYGLSSAPLTATD